jgi:hypothetical protein
LNTKLDLRFDSATRKVLEIELAVKASPVVKFIRGIFDQDTANDIDRKTDTDGLKVLVLHSFHTCHQLNISCYQSSKHTVAFQYLKGAIIPQMAPWWLLEKKDSTFRTHCISNALHSAS